MPTSKDKKSPDIFFRFYWNDYSNNTKHLTMLQHGAYEQLMLAYYSSGKPLPQDHSKLFRMVGAFTQDEQAAVISVLDEFFTKADGMYHSNRCDRELIRIAKARDDSDKANRKRWHGDADGTPVGDADGTPDGSPSSSSSSSSSSKQDQKQKQDQKHPTNLPSIKENDNSENGRSDRQDAVCQKAFTSSKSNSQEWIKFVAGLRDQDADVQNWVLYGETETKVRAAVEQYGAEGLFLALGDWKEVRRPPVSGLDYPWQVFLREAENNLKEWAEAVKNHPRVYTKGVVK
jgi:uncharacterized protein YdaU (DUF1376 family)